jgi:quercetin dioxygenase-like cupin family protein
MIDSNNNIATPAIILPKGLHINQAPGYVFLGVRMNILLSGQQTGGQFSLIEAFMPPGGDGGLHIHAHEDETLHVLAGELEVTIGDECFTLLTGETSFGPRNIPHRIRNKGAQDARVFLINSPGTFDGFVQLAGIPAGVAATRPPAPPTPEQIQQLLGLAEQFGVTVLAPPEL